MKRIEVYNKPIYVVADVHGAFDIFEKYINHNELSDCVIIVAGDSGIGFYRKNYYERIFSSMNNHFIEKNIHCYMIRGNHDDPYYFDGEQINFSNIKAISDYTIIYNDKCNILCVGGALSIDRKYRITNYWRKVEDYATVMNVTLEEAKSKFLPSYWNDEVPIFDEDILNEIKENGINIDYVITHTSPSFAFKSDKNGIDYWLKIDDALDNDLNNERSIIDKLYEKLVTDGHIIKNWVYGHFHEHNDEIINNIQFTALMNCDFKFDIKELKYDI